MVFDQFAIYPLYLGWALVSCGKNFAQNRSRSSRKYRFHPMVLLANPSVGNNKFATLASRLLSQTQRRKQRNTHTSDLSGFANRTRSYANQNGIRAGIKKTFGSFIFRGYSRSQIHR